VLAEPPATPSLLPSGAVARPSDSSDKKAESAEKRDLSLEERVKKADRLFAARDWTAAAAAYRDLFARFPAYKDAPKWRDRLNASLFAEQEGRKADAAKAAAKPAKAKKSTEASEALDGR